MKKKPQDTNLALLIDADNASSKYLDRLISEVAGFGRTNVRRAYGDWTRPQFASWKSMLLSHSIQPIQQFAYTAGKNATDSSLIIDAMDLLYGGRVDGFCLVSSDSDFTRLAQRIREEGLFVYGFGARQTPKPFMQACDRFTYLEVLETEEDQGAGVDFYDSADMLFSQKTLKPTDVAISITQKAIKDVADERGFVNIGALKNHILRIEPDFDTRLFNFSKFSDFLRAYPRFFEVSERKSSDGSSKVLIVKNAKRDGT